MNGRERLCGTCIHNMVCKHQQVLDNIDNILINMSSPIALDVAMTQCMEYTEDKPPISHKQRIALGIEGMCEQLYKRHIKPDTLVMSKETGQVVFGYSIEPYHVPYTVVTARGDHLGVMWDNQMALGAVLVKGS